MQYIYYTLTAPPAISTDEGRPLTLSVDWFLVIGAGRGGLFGTFAYNTLV